MTTDREMPEATDSRFRIVDEKPIVRWYVYGNDVMRFDFYEDTRHLIPDWWKRIVYRFVLGSRFEWVRK